MIKLATTVPGPYQLLTDIQVPGLDATTSDLASSSGETVTSGTNGKIQMTPNSVGNTKPKTNTKWHGLYLEIEPGVLNPGQTAPDLQMWLELDNTSHGNLKSYLYLDLTQTRLMLPPRRATIGRQYVRLGNSMYLDAVRCAQLQQQGMSQAAARGAAFGGGNWPSKYTGPKIVDGITYHFSSTSGFTTSATDQTKTFASPPTIKLYGDVYNASMWNFVAGQMGAWNGAISLTSLRRQLLGLLPNPYVATHNVAAGLSFAGDGFQQLPDGSKQGGGAVVHRFMRFTTALNDVSGTDIYPLTNTVTGVNGKAGQVGTNNEFGFPFALNKNALQVTEFGHRPVAGSGYWGLTTGSQNRYPGETEYGALDTVGAPRNWYGPDSPLRSETGLYTIMPRIYGYSGPEADVEVLAGEDVAFFTSAQNGLTITASTEFFAIGGVMIES